MRNILAPAMLAMAMLVSGCISVRAFVDPALGDVPASQHATVASPQPVQLVFLFQSKGANSPRATALLMQQVTEKVSASGLFSEVSSAPVPSGALLSVTINNVPEADAASRGIGVGLTFGLAGQMVTDYYVGTAHYTPGGSAPVINAEEHHSIHSMVGAGAGPAGMVASPNLDTAIHQVVDQLMDHLLNDVARDPGFSGSSVHAGLNPAFSRAAFPTTPLVGR